MKQLNVGLVGLGTVGGGTYTVLARNGDEMARRTGVTVKVTHVADRNLARANELTKGAVAITDDAFALVAPLTGEGNQMQGSCGRPATFVLIGRISADFGLFAVLDSQNAIADAQPLQTHQLQRARAVIAHGVVMRGFAANDTAQCDITVKV